MQIEVEKKRHWIKHDSPSYRKESTKGKQKTDGERGKLQQILIARRMFQIESAKLRRQMVQIFALWYRHRNLRSETP